MFHFIPIYLIFYFAWTNQETAVSHPGPDTPLALMLKCSDFSPSDLLRNWRAIPLHPRNHWWDNLQHVHFFQKLSRSSPHSTASEASCGALTCFQCRIPLKARSRPWNLLDRVWISYAHNLTVSARAYLATSSSKATRINLSRERMASGFKLSMSEDPLLSQSDTQMSISGLRNRLENVVLRYKPI